MEQVQLEEGAGGRTAGRDCQGELGRGEDATSRKAHAQVCSPRPRVERGAEPTPTHLGYSHKAAQEGGAPSHRAGSHQATLLGPPFGRTLTFKTIFVFFIFKK